MMKKKRITFVPVGGLANRMKAMDAAITLAQRVGSDLKVIWFPDWGMKCRFDQLFLPIAESGLLLKEATSIDYLVNDRPRKKNFWAPRLFQQLRFAQCIYENDAPKLYKEGFDFAQWATGRDSYMAAFLHFYGEEPVYYPRFVPIPALQQRINEVTASFGNCTIGIHIRRTDNVLSIQQSPTELFITRMHEEIANDDNVQFYLATDSEEDKRLLREEFGERILTSPRKADRDSVEGIQDALVEMYVLSRTKYLLGSFYSTFSQVAALIGNIRCEVIAL